MADGEYRKAVQKIFDLRLRCVKDGLRKIGRLLGLMGDPHRDIDIVRVVGTNGKGSVSAMLASILGAAGYRVGLNTSPHLIDFTERIRIDGVPVSRDEVVELYGEIAPFIRRMEDEPGMGCPTYFEVTTAMALSIFLKRECDIVILEAGIGGLSDTTHITEPILTVITRIAMDHAEKLGGDLLSIAGDKAEAIPEGGACVCWNTPELLEIILRTASEKDASVRVVDPCDVSVLVTEADGTRFTFRLPDGGFYDLFVPMTGDFQAENGALAAIAAKELGTLGYTVTGLHIKDGLSKTRWPGRMEVTRRKPLTIVDCGHNPDAAARVARALAPFPRDRTILVMGICEEKDVAAVLEGIIPVADEIIFTKADNERAVEPLRLARMFGGKCSTASGIGEAMQRAGKMAGENDLILVFGSVYLAGEALSVLGEREK